MAIDLQHIQIKLILREQEVDLAPLVPVFHSWIQEQRFEELLIDVADYRHVPDGPGVMVIGHEADYSVDQADGLLGVRYSRKSILNSNNQQRLRQCARSALHAFQLLEQESRLGEKLQFNGRDIEITINDRLLAPNTSETREVLEPEFRTFGDWLFGPGTYRLSWKNDPKRLLSAMLQGSDTKTTQELLNKT